MFDCFKYLPRSNTTRYLVEDDRGMLCEVGRITLWAIYWYDDDNRDGVVHVKGIDSYNDYYAF